MFIGGVMLTTVYFIATNKADRLNRDALRDEVARQKDHLNDQQKQIDAININIDLLHRERSAIRNVELKDRVLALETKTTDLQNQISLRRPIVKVVMPEVPASKPARRARVSQ